MAMVLARITAGSAAVGAGTPNPLPPPFDWATIAASGSKDFPIHLSDLSLRSNPSEALTNGARLNAMMGKGLVTLAKVAVTNGPGIDAESVLA
jgi:hypothetical protein